MAARALCVRQAEAVCLEFAHASSEPRRETEQHVPGDLLLTARMGNPAFLLLSSGIRFPPPIAKNPAFPARGLLILPQIPQVQLPDASIDPCVPAMQGRMCLSLSVSVICAAARLHHLPIRCANNRHPSGRSRAGFPAGPCGQEKVPLSRSHIHPRIGASFLFRFFVTPPSRYCRPISFPGAHLDSATKSPPPTLGPVGLMQKGQKVTAQKGHNTPPPLRSSILGHLSAYRFDTCPLGANNPTGPLGRWSGGSAPESGILFIRAPADFMSVER